MTRYYFELCCEARYMREVLGLTIKEVDYIQNTYTNACVVRCRMAKDIPFETMREVGSRAVIERYKRHQELRKDRYAA